MKYVNFLLKKIENMEIQHLNLKEYSVNAQI